MSVADSLFAGPPPCGPKAVAMAPRDNLRLCESFLHHERVRADAAVDGSAARVGSLNYQLPAERERGRDRAVNGGASGGAGGGGLYENVLLVSERGDCPYALKALHAYEVGAAGLIVLNDPGASAAGA